MKCNNCGTEHSAPADFDANDVVCPNCSPVFRGDFRCLCGKHSFVEWQRHWSALHCSQCRRAFTMEETISICSTYKPERNTLSPDELRRRVAHNLGSSVQQPAVEEEQSVYFGESFTNADGSTPSSPKPDRSFWHPLEFTKNFLVGSAVLIGGQMLWELKQSIFGDDQPR